MICRASASAHSHGHSQARGVPSRELDDAARDGWRAPDVVGRSVGTGTAGCHADHPASSGRKRSERASRLRHSTMAPSDLESFGRCRTSAWNMRRLRRPLDRTSIIDLLPISTCRSRDPWPARPSAAASSGAVQKHGLGHLLAGPSYVHAAAANAGFGFCGSPLQRPCRARVGRSLVWHANGVVASRNLAC